MMKDYRVELKVKNNLLWQAIIATGCSNVSQFSKRYGVWPGAIYNYLNLKRTPINKDGSWRKDALHLGDIFKTSPENLFPPQHVWEGLLKNTGVLEMSWEDIERLPMSAAAMLTDNHTPETEAMEEDTRSALLDSLNGLGPRDRLIIEGRFGLYGEPKTFEQLGDELGVSMERIRQIECRVMRKLAGTNNYRSGYFDPRSKQRARHLKYLYGSKNVG